MPDKPAPPPGRRLTLAEIESALSTLGLGQIRIALSLKAIVAALSVGSTVNMKVLDTISDDVSILGNEARDLARKLLGMPDDDG